jgi:hypothetical protein
MRAISPLLLCLAWACVASAQYENLPGVSLYSHGYLLSWDTPSYAQFTLYGRDAKPAFSALERTDSYQVSWAADSDGVAAAAYSPTHQKEGHIDVLDQAGIVIGTINTGSYIPRQVAFAPDHTVWAACYNAGSLPGQDFNVLHHYARTGEELGQALSYAQIGGDLKHPVIESPRGLQLLHIANDRVGWNEALHTGSRTWVELSFSGDFLGKYELKTPDGLSVMSVAMTASGNVYAMILKPIGEARFAVLNREKGVWEKVSGDPGGVVIGSEGDNLAFLQTDGAKAALKFAPSGSLRAEHSE